MLNTDSPVSSHYSVLCGGSWPRRAVSNVRRWDFPSGVFDYLDFWLEFKGFRGDIRPDNGNFPAFTADVCDRECGGYDTVGLLVLLFSQNMDARGIGIAKGRMVYGMFVPPMCYLLRNSPGVMPVYCRNRLIKLEME